MCPGVSFGLNLFIAYPVRFTKAYALEPQLPENPVTQVRLGIQYRQWMRQKALYLMLELRGNLSVF